MFDSVIEKNKHDFPSLKKSALKVAFGRFKEKKEKENKVINLPATSSNTIANNEAVDSLLATGSNDFVGEPTIVTPREKGGRPKGTTIIQQREKKESIVRAKNSIALCFKYELEHVNTQLKKQKVDMMVSMVKKAQLT